MNIQIPKKSRGACSFLGQLRPGNVWHDSLPRRSLGHPTKKAWAEECPSMHFPFGNLNHQKSSKLTQNPAFPATTFKEHN